MAESNEIFDPQVFLNPHPSYHNSCKDAHIWDGPHKWYPRLRVAVFAILILYYVFLIPVLFIFARKASSQAKKILAWYTFVPAIASMFIWLLIALVADSFLNCLRISDLKYLKIFTAVNVFRNLANVLMLGIVILPVASSMVKHTKCHAKPRFAQIAHSVLLCLVAIFAILHVIFWDYNDIHSIKGQKTIDNHSAISATYVTLYFAAALNGGAHIVMSCWEGRRKKISMKGIFPFGGLLAVSLIGFALIDMIVIYRYKVQSHHVWTRSASITFGILSLFFQACVFLLLCIIARSSALGRDDVHDEHHEEKALNGDEQSQSVVPTNDPSNTNGTNGTQI